MTYQQYMYLAADLDNPPTPPFRVRLKRFFLRPWWSLRGRLFLWKWRVIGYLNKWRRGK